MRKLSKLLFGAFVLVGVLSILNISTANAIDIQQKSLTMIDKSATTILYDEGISELTITPNIEFSQLGDYITYKLVLNNRDNTNFQIKDVTDNNTNNTIKIEYIYPAELNTNDKEIIFTLRYHYFDPTATLSAIKIVVTIADEDGNTLTIPSTGQNTKEQTFAQPSYFGIFVFIGGTILYLIFCTIINRSRKIKEKVKIKNRTAVALTFIVIQGITMSVAATTSSDLIFDLNLDNVVINDSYLMVQSEWENPTKTYGKAIAKNSFEKIIVVDSNTVPASALDSWDVSEAQNGSIMAWYTDADNNGLYELFIGQNGGVKANPMSYCVFYQFSKVNYLDVSKFDTSRATMLNYIFGDTGSQDISGTFEIVGLSDWDTSSVTDMSNAFNVTGSLATTWKIGDLSKWHTSKVTSFDSMFAYAGQNATIFKLEGLDKWETSAAESMGWAFYKAGLKAKTFDVDLTNWNTSSVTNMTYMFYSAGENATSWRVAGLSGWNTSKVKDMSYMFSGAGANAPRLDLDLSSWKTSSVTNMHYMFKDFGLNSDVFSLNVTGWDTSSVTQMSHMFDSIGKNSTTWSISGLPGWKVENVVEMGKMFLQAGMNADTFALGDLSGWNLAKATHMHGLFTEAGKNAGVWESIGTLNIPSVKYMQEMFLNCPQAKATLNIYKNPSNYTNAFLDAATEPGASIVVNYSNDTTKINEIVEAKSPESHVALGSLLP